MNELPAEDVAEPELLSLADRDRLLIETHQMLADLASTVTMVKGVIARAPKAVSDAPPIMRPLLKMMFPE